MESDKCNRCYRCNSFFITLTALISPIMLNAEKQVSGKIEMVPVEEATPEDLESFMDEIDE